MMRSGSTLQYQLVGSILAATGKGKAIGEARQTSCKAVLQANPDIPNIAVKVHKISYLKGVKQAIAQGEAKGVYIYRDIRDVVVSLMNFRKADFEQIVFRGGEFKQCLNNYYAWTSLDQMLVSQYETMSKNITAEVLTIAEHLDINLSTELAEAIAIQHTLEKQKQKIQQRAAAGSINSENPETMLQYNHINSGKSKQWQERLSSIEIAYLESEAGEWLNQHGYQLSQPAYQRWLSQVAFSKYKLERQLKKIRK